VTRRRQRQRGRRLQCWMIGLVLATLTPLVVHAEPDAPKREVPDYDGRPEPTTAGDVLLWVPRIVLSPLYLVSEFVVRRPLGFLLTAAERAQLPSFLYDLFTFGPDHNAGLLPVAFLDFGLAPSVGLLFFWNDLVPHHDLNARFSLWGIHWLAGNVAYTVHMTPSASIGVHFSGRRRPDLLFYGIGPRALESERSRYGSSLLEGGIDSEVGGGHMVHLTSGIGLRSMNFHAGGWDGDPDLQRAVDQGRYPSPPGYDTGYTVLYDRMRLSIDSRADSPTHFTGVRLEASVEQHSDLRSNPESGYLRYGASLGGFYDLNDRGRVISLSVITMFADPLGQKAIPFTELVSLGGAGPMRGFLPGRLVDRSAAVATLRYRWPIWVFLDGSLQFAVGNVFGEHLEGFKASLLRLSAALGFESGKADNSLEFLVGIGSETFEHGTQITSLRIVIGTNHGF
jgi:hypothetical protein